MQKLSKESKLNVIKRVLNGTFNFNELEEPQNYWVLLEDGIYISNGEVIANSSEEFEQWQKDNTDERSVIFLMTDGSPDSGLKNEPLVDVSHGPTKLWIEKKNYQQPTVIDEPIIENEAPTTLILDSNRLLPYNVLNDSSETQETSNKGERIEPEIVQPVRKGGLLSNYGETWRLSEKTVDALNILQW